MQQSTVGSLSYYNGRVGHGDSTGKTKAVVSSGRWHWLGANQDIQYASAEITKARLT